MCRGMRDDKGGALLAILLKNWGVIPFTKSKTGG